MNAKNRIIVWAALVLLPGPVFSLSLEALVGSEQAAVLRTGGGSITEVQSKSPSPRLAPQHAELRFFVNEILASLGPNIMVETLALYKKPNAAVGSDTTVDSIAGWSDAERAGLFNRLLALSTLTGIQYYSTSRKAMRTFYESSQVIDGPDSRKVLSDPVYAVPPSSLAIYARQKDSTFGDNIYRYDYRNNMNAFFLMQENVTAMNAGIIPAIGKNNLRTVMAIIDAGDNLLLYAVSMAKAAVLPGLGDRIGSSFSTRADAMFKWLAGQADQVFSN